MNRQLHAGMIALGCLGALLAYAGYLGLRAEPFTCGDSTCQEAHP